MLKHKKAQKDNLSGLLHRRTLYPLFLACAVLISLEVYFRIIGIVPGKPVSCFLGIRVVDSLINYEVECTDSLGLVCYSPALDGVNEQGFRSNINFTREVADSATHCGKKKILVIGDSFTEGITSTTSDHKLMELVQAEKAEDVFFVCGIGGTDPLNYRLIAEKFIPELQPDLVIINYCGENDNDYPDRIAIPYLPLQYYTNAGQFYSNPNPEFSDGIPNHILPTPDSAYHFYLNHISFFSGEKKFHFYQKNLPFVLK